MRDFAEGFTALAGIFLVLTLQLPAVICGVIAALFWTARWWTWRRAHPKKETTSG